MANILCWYVYIKNRLAKDLLLFMQHSPVYCDTRKMCHNAQCCHCYCGWRIFFPPLYRNVSFWAIVIWSIFFSKDTEGLGGRPFVGNFDMRADAPLLSGGLCHTSCSNVSWMTQTSVALQEKTLMSVCCCVMAAAMKSDGGGRVFSQSLVQGWFMSYLTASGLETLWKN